MPAAQGYKLKAVSMTPHDIAEVRRLRKLAEAESDSHLIRLVLRALRDVKEPFDPRDLQLKPRRKPRSQ